jgi:hypothetical protein
MFQQVIAIIRGSWFPQKLLKQSINIYLLPLPLFVNQPLNSRYFGTLTTQQNVIPCVGNNIQYKSHYITNAQMKVHS